MYHCVSVSADHPELNALITQPDTFQQALYPEESNQQIELHALKKDQVCCFLLCDAAGDAVGCGALVKLNARDGEIKRVFVKPECRGLNLGESLLAALEQQGRELGYGRLLLETSIHQQPAISLYQRCGYQLCPPFEPWQSDPLSVFMEKSLA